MAMSSTAIKSHFTHPRRVARNRAAATEKRVHRSAENTPMKRLVPRAFFVLGADLEVGIQRKSRP